MKHIKPGRGPSGMAFIGSIGAAVFGVFWTVTALTITRDAPGGIGIFFPLFGVFFIVRRGYDATQRGRGRDLAWGVRQGLGRLRDIAHDLGWLRDRVTPTEGGYAEAAGVGLRFGLSGGLA